MPYRCLADFLEDLSHAGELTRIEDCVDPALDVAGATARGMGGPALLFGAVKGHDIPVLTNLLATEARIGRALGVGSLQDAADRMARLFDVSSPGSWFERLKGGAQPAAISAAMPREVRAAACQQIVRLGSDIDLRDLPFLQSAPEETGRFLPAATVFSAEPDTHQTVAGRFDVQFLDADRLAVCWEVDDDHARLLGAYGARRQPMPAAVILGGDPAFLLAAASPLPPGSDVCAAAGLLREKSLDVVDGRSIPLQIPAEAEIVLEGFIDPAAPTATVGPRCAPLGHCAPPRPAPMLHVTAVTHRANPVYVAMTPGKPPHEACRVARAMQRVFLPLTCLAMPDLNDYDLPEFAAARHWATVSIRKTYPGQGRRAAHAAWRLRPLQYAKMLVIVDADIDVRDQQAILAAVAANVNPARDVIDEAGPADPFDPAGRDGPLGQRMAVDATRKLAGE